MEMTEFERIASERKSGIRSERPSRLTPAQKVERKILQETKNRLRNEARRRAHIVLQYRYGAEFHDLLEQELENLVKNDPKYAIIAGTKNMGSNLETL